MSVIYSPRQMYVKFIHYMYLDYDQLVLADKYNKGQIVDFLLDSKHEFCSCTKLPYKTNIRKI